ncbi:hypothetical protein BDR05DRAFT_957349 [Suillus weaverae]|nr:hypothetical protein BDR05DRAFT_957349 [Suillus weaverae]
MPTFRAHTVTGQYPTLFNAALLRNPVISVGELASGTDIPNWVYADFRVSSTDSLTPSHHPHPAHITHVQLQLPTSDTPTPPTPLMTPQTYSTLFTASPIAHIENITAPVLIFIGEDDLRVVPGRGLGFIMRSRGEGVEQQLEMEPGARMGTRMRMRPGLERLGLGRKSLVPSLVHQLVHHSRFKIANPSSIKGIGCGAAHLPPQLADQLRA